MISKEFNIETFLDDIKEVRKGTMLVYTNGAQAARTLGSIEMNLDYIMPSDPTALFSKAIDALLERKSGGFLIGKITKGGLDFVRMNMQGMLLTNGQFVIYNPLTDIIRLSISGSYLYNFNGEHNELAKASIDEIMQRSERRGKGISLKEYIKPTPTLKRPANAVMAFDLFFSYTCDHQLNKSKDYIYEGCRLN